MNATRQLDLFTRPAPPPRYRCLTCSGSGHPYVETKKAGPLGTVYAWEQRPCPVCHGDRYVSTPQIDGHVPL